MNDMTNIDICNCDKLIIEKNKIIKAYKDVDIIDETNIKYISRCAFELCRELKYVNIPNVIRLGPVAFRSCFILTNINIPKVKEICEATFQHCVSLTYINLPKVVKIGRDAFYNSGLISINIPKCKEIDKEAFGCCEKLSMINSNLSEEQLIFALGGEEHYKNYLIRNREYKINKLYEEK